MANTKKTVAKEPKTQKTTKAKVEKKTVVEKKTIDVETIVKENKKVLFVAGEAVPFIKTGGLADVAGALPKALCEKGIDARVMLPLYLGIPREYKNNMQFLGHCYVQLGWRSQYCGVFT